MINYLRCVAQNSGYADALRIAHQLSKESASEFLSDDRYLAPALENDALLYSLPDQELEQELEQEGKEEGKENEKTEDKNSEIKFDQDENTSDVTCDPRDDYYFDSYSHWGIHKEMLKDEV